ncbi:MAG: hypothetical protein HRT63_12550 [Erythrobacter sp.]|nr:hypothetical protein [Erythrobacter sp.]
MKQVLYVGDRMLKMAKGEPVQETTTSSLDITAPSAGVAVDAKLLKEACTKEPADTNLLGSVRSNNLAEFMYRAFHNNKIPLYHQLLPPVRAYRKSVKRRAGFQILVFLSDFSFCQHSGGQCTQ